MGEATEMPTAAVIAEHIWWICALAFTLLRRPFERRVRTQTTRVDWRNTTDWLLLRLAVLGFGILPFVYVVTDFPRFANYPFFAPFAAAGAVVFLAGMWVIYRAHRDLGLSFSGVLEIWEGHRLVTTGIYGYVRHPIYLAYVLWAAAQAMLLPNWIAGFSALACGALLFSFRIPREERMMIEAFGDQYRAYMARTARLVPGII
jgi:protein-S-isoprenylcysteine O-methyltransferase Ste14